MEKESRKSDEKRLASDATTVPDEFSLLENSCKHLNLDEQSSSSYSLKLITYNIDGYSGENLITRAAAVCKIIDAKKADIVFLQEVVQETAKYIEERMRNYHCFFPEEDKEDLQDVKDKEGEEDEKDSENAEHEEDEESEGDDEDDEIGRYFNGTLLKKSSLSLVDEEVIYFPTEGSRHLLKINARFKDLPICLLNSHFTSCSEDFGTRKIQLEVVFGHILDAPENTTVIFGGDVNIRDKELTEVGGLPTAIEDVWVACGSQKRCKYTFDMFQNDNFWKVKWKAKCRLDHVYIRRSSPSMLKPTSFELIGLERLPFYGVFPSDHWGVLCHFDKDDFRFKLNDAFLSNNHEVQSLQPYWIRKKLMH